jgi:hypothetical protein
VTNSAEWTTRRYDSAAHYFEGLSGLYTLAACPREFNVLYHNNGDGTFTDVTAKAGLKGKGWSGDVAVFDFNEDGYLDLLVTNMFGQSQLYRNNGNGTFTDVSKTALGRTSWGAIGSKAFDFDNDGRLDLLIVDMHSDMWIPPTPDPLFASMIRTSATKKYPTVTGAWRQFNPQMAEQGDQSMADVFHIRSDEVVFGNTFFRNLGHGKFEEVSDQAGLETFWPWGIATGDFDNDGFEDVFLPSGMGFPFFYWPSSLMMNNGNGTFTDRAASLGIEPPPDGLYQEKRIGGVEAARSSRCAATADFSGSGRLDIVTNNFNDRPFYFKNEMPARHYLEFRLQGRRSNRDAIGALVKLYCGKEVMVRQVQAAGGYLSQSSRTVHFGLGERASVDKVEIRWPSGIRQSLDQPVLNLRYDVIEPAG